MQKLIRPTVFLVCLLPFMYLLGRGITDNLGANPIEAITHFTGDWALNFLLISLAITPLRQLTGKTYVVTYRRMMGLYAFFYVCLHFSCYLVLDHFFYWETIIEDIIKRPYITVGFAAFVLLIPLTITSTKNMMRRLGKKWKILHRLVYIISPLAILHYLWLVKSDIRVPAIYAIIFIILMLSRIYRYTVSRKITA